MSQLLTKNRVARSPLHVTIPLCVAFAGLVGCNSASTPPEATDSSTPTAAAEGDAVAPVTIVDGEMPTDAQREKMLAAKDALFKTLSGRLMETMGMGGPEAAITVCQKEALQLTQSVGDEYSLKIGRTGVRLRNPKNQAPEWAQTYTEAQHAEPVFAMLSDGSAAALLPIKLKAACLMCHGPKDQLAPVIQTKLASLYPNDEATGFQEGDLRGWFWLELPPS